MNSQLLGKAGVSLLIHAYQIKLILILINQINLKKKPTVCLNVSKYCILQSLINSTFNTVLTEDEVLRGLKMLPLYSSQ